MQKFNEKNTTKPAYLFRGKQDLLIEREIETIRNGFIDKINEFNYFVLDAESVNISEILENANTTSMFEDRKLILVKNAEKLKSADIKQLENYLDSPAPGSCIILWSREGRKPSTGKKSKLSVKTFEEAENISKLISDESRRFNINLSKNAVKLLHDLLGDDLRIINNEIIKLSQFYNDKDYIDEKDVQDFVTNRKSESIFELTNAVSEKDKQKAFSVLSVLEASGHDPVSILSTLAWRFRQINQAKQYIEENLSGENILKKIGTSKGAFYFLSRHCKNFTFDDLRRIYRSIKETDLKLKSTSQDPYSLLSKLVIEICRR